MDSTSLSLLDCLRRGPDEGSWARLDHIYRPWIARWLARDPSLGADVEDLTQEILSVVFRELPRFEHRGHGSFRRWLRAIAAFRLKGYYRARQTLARALPAGGEDGRLIELADDRSDLARAWDAEHDRHVVRRLLELIDPDFNETQKRAFRRVVFEEAAPADVAAELGVTVNVVLLAKSRILKRIRAIGKDLLG